METRNILLVDDNKLLAGSVGKYLKDRFGKGISVQTFRGAEPGIKVTEKDSVIMVLDYSLNGNGRHKSKERVEEIKEQNPLADVVVLPAPGNAANDIVETVKTIEKDAASYLISHELPSVKKIAAKPSKPITPLAQVLSREHSIGYYFGMFLILFAGVDAFVLVVLLLIEWYNH